MLLEDTVRFLLEISEELVGNDLREDFNPIAIKWKQLFDVSMSLPSSSFKYLVFCISLTWNFVLSLQNVNKYMDAGVVVQNRKKYYHLLEELQKWIVKTENILNTPQTNTNEDIMNYCRQLQVLNNLFI